MDAPTKSTDSRGVVFDAPNVKVLRDEVMLSIERAIFLGSIRPGERLVEAEIARQMGISKAPVREALRGLEQYGLVVSLPRRGTFVTRLTATLASEAFSLRAVLEAYVLRLVTPMIEPRHVATLRRLLEPRAGNGPEPDTLVERDIAFHDYLFELSGHRLLQQAWANIRQQVRLLLTVSGTLRSESATADHDCRLREVHEPILEALERRDVDRAVAAIIDHMAVGERQLLEKLTDGPVTLSVRRDLVQ